MTGACDERSHGGGCEQEEPTEPPALNGCSVKVFGGYLKIKNYLDSLKPELYRYNSQIRHTGYYLKPVHKVYYKTIGGKSRLYEYYGRYWWKISKKGGKRRLVYVGTLKPEGLPEPPRTGLEGVKLIVEDDDVTLDCSSFRKIEHILAGLKVEYL